MTHAETERVRRYGGRLIQVDGRRVVEMRDPNDNARRRFQYRAALGGGLEARVLRADGQPFDDSGSPWERRSAAELAEMRAQRGEYHPILDPLGL